MKYTLYRVAALLLTLALSFACVGCAKQPADAAATVSYAELMNMMNQTVESDLGQAVGTPSGWTAHKGKLWVAGHQPGQVQDTSQRQLWVASAATDGTGVSALQLTGDFDPDLAAKRDSLAQKHPDTLCTTSWWVQSLMFDSVDQLYFVLCESLSTQAPEDDYAQTQDLQFTLCGAAADGSLQRGPMLRFPRQMEEGSVYPNWCRMTDDRTMWVYAVGTADEEQIGALLRFDTADGSCTAQLELANASEAKTMPDGSLLLVASGSEKGKSLYSLTGLDADSPTLTEQTKLQKSNQVKAFLQPLDGVPTDELLLYGMGGILRCDPATGELEELLDWQEYGIQPTAPTRAVFYYPKGATTQFLRVDGENQLSVLSLVDRSALEALPTITVVVYGASAQLNAAIHAYNAAGHDYYIKTVQYSTITENYIPGTDQLASRSEELDRDRLMRDIATSNGPDIIIMGGGIDYDGLARKGYFLDLYPYLDADPELSRDALLPNILQDSELNGTLPTMVASFMAATIVTDRDLVSSDPGWTLKEYEALLAQYPDSRAFFSQQRYSFLNSLMISAGSRFIDRQTGKVSFDSPEFIRMLELTAQLPATDLTSDILNQKSMLRADDPELNEKQAALDAQMDPKPVFDAKQALMLAEHIGGFRDILTYEYAFDGPVTYKGFPSADGTAGATILPLIRFGISTTCEYPDAAWDFLRTLLLPAYQNEMVSTGAYTMPVRRDTLQAMADAAMQPILSEEEVKWRYVPSYLISGVTKEQLAYWSQGVTQAQADQLLAVIYSASGISNYDEQLSTIIQEEAEYFYNGVRTAAEAAAIMQDRAQTYLDEKG